MKYTICAIAVVFSINILNLGYQNVDAITPVCNKTKEVCAFKRTNPKVCRKFKSECALINENIDGDALNYNITSQACCDSSGYQDAKCLFEMCYLCDKTCQTRDVLTCGKFNGKCRTFESPCKMERFACLERQAYVNTMNRTMCQGLGINPMPCVK